MTAPPPGCVEQRLSALGVALQPAERLHSELDIPRSPHTPYSLQLLLDMFRDQYLAFIDRMNSPDYHHHVRHQIDKEKVKMLHIYIHSTRHRESSEGTDTHARYYYKSMRLLCNLLSSSICVCTLLEISMLISSMLCSGRNVMNGIVCRSNFERAYPINHGF